MALKMHRQCERCDPVLAEDGIAFVCGYERFARSKHRCGSRRREGTC